VYERTNGKTSIGRIFRALAAGRCTESNKKKEKPKGITSSPPRKGIKVDWITDELHGNDILPFRNFFFSVFTQFSSSFDAPPEKVLESTRSVRQMWRHACRIDVGWDGCTGRRTEVSVNELAAVTTKGADDDVKSSSPTIGLAGQLRSASCFYSD
jgi:hypothetical protein